MDLLFRAVLPTKVLVVTLPGRGIITVKAGTVGVLCSSTPYSLEPAILILTQS